MHRLAALSLCFALGACQGPNPYRAESLPLPPAPPAVAAPLEPGVYPAPPRDYAAYRDWAWLHDHPPDGDAGLDAAQVQEILSAELDRRGLRPARPGAEADLRVSAQLTLKRRIRIYRDYYDRFGGYYGYGHHWDRFGVWGRAPLVYRYKEQVLVVRIAFTAGMDGRRFWHGSGEARVDTEQSGRAKALRQAARLALQGFPP
ncbi:DUF4136 domain-containing protein [Azorhizophilus paspali]|uniref:DUF4136 domain-containing protein n=1 Tax=Azorhizophilus paspali TaxID=69963 RepID=A0ABV6SQU5_AZOPA